MSNLLKSKFLLGAMIVAIMFVGVVAFDATPAAADCSITSTLRVGSKGDQVKCLQTIVGATADGSFGPLTKAAVMAWQSGRSLVADGVVGPLTRAALLGGAVSGNFPAGCSSASGYSSTTGVKCDSVQANTFPAGCTSASGYSPTTGASCSTGAVAGQTGPVSASLASDNPASGYIIGGQATADLAHFTFSGVGTLNTVVLQRTGVSDQNTLSSVYLYDGATRLTDGYSFNNSGQLTMNSLGVAVNGSKTLSVKADVAVVTNASSLGITLVSFIAVGNSSVTANVKGNEMTYGVGNLASVYVAANPSAGGTATVNAGTSAYTVWSAPVQVNVRAVWLKGANFRLTGSAPADALGNIKLFVDGVQVGTAATMGTITGSNYAMFDFAAAPVSLSTGTHTVDLRADVVKGSSYTVTASIQQASDLVLYDGQVGVNIAALGPAGVTYTANSGAEITINAGSASVTIDPTFQSLTNITGGATNVTIGKFKVHGYGEDVKVSSLVVKPAITSGTVASGVNITTLNNITVYFNGSQVGSSANYSGTALTFTLGSQMIIPAGTDSYIEIKGDLQNSDSINYTGGTVSAALNGLTNNAQGQTSKTNVSFPATTGTNTSGVNLTIQTGVLAVSKNTGYASQSVSPNSDNVKLGSFVLQNQSSSESVRVTSLAVTLFTGAGATMTSGTTPALTNFLNLRTSETSGSGAQPIQPSASNTFSVDFTIAPGATKTIDVLASTGSTVGGASMLTKLVVTSLGSSSNVSVSQNGDAAAVTGQTITLAVG
ncbi:MAG: Cell wall lytic activity, partial [Candidatus Nomurabacteria bacterium GW2011_GWC2_41_8]